MAKTEDIELEISVSGSIYQHIRLKPEFAMEQSEFVSKVKENKILTSVGHGGGCGKVYLLDGFVQIGEVVSQDSGDDMEIYVYPEYDTYKE